MEEGSGFQEDQRELNSQTEVSNFDFYKRVCVCSDYLCKHDINLTCRKKNISILRLQISILNI